MSANDRSQRLQKHFNNIIQGKTQIAPQNSGLFIEAICSQPDAAACIDKLSTSSNGLSSVQSAMRFDTTPSFFNEKGAKLLHYLSLQELAGIGGGTTLRSILKAIVDPPIFWNPFAQSYIAGELNESSQQCFAWLLLQLIQFPGEQASPYIDLLSDSTILDTILASDNYEIKGLGYQIKHIVNTCGAGVVGDTQFGPGGRHDNDFANFRDISILPTPDEITSPKPAFFRTGYTVEETEEDLRLATHLDNQFRLFREDMLYEMRDDLLLAFGRKSGKYRGVSFKGLTLLSIFNELKPSGKKCKWGLVFRCSPGQDLWQIRKLKNKERKKYLTEHPNLFKHQSLTCLRIDDQVCAFLTVRRDEDRLALSPPEIMLHLESQNDVAGILLRLVTAKPEKISLYQIDTAVFAYEPVLTTLQQIQKITLSPEIMLWKEGQLIQRSPYAPEALVAALQQDPTRDLKNLLGTQKSIRLDHDQGKSLVQGLTQTVSLIQGPPGTGKSFIGALLAKALYDHTTETILVVCYTNHALDQFLEDLLDIGIPSSSLVRLGGKSTPKTEPLSLFKLMSGPNRRFKPLSRAEWTSIDALKRESDVLGNEIADRFNKLLASNPKYSDYLEYLEFEDPEYYSAFRVPDAADGMQRVGTKGKNIQPDYLIHRWFAGHNAGIFSNAQNVRSANEVWTMTHPRRSQLVTEWRKAMTQEAADYFAQTARRYNSCLDEIDYKFSESNRALLQTKRIIGCTTTAAAKYREDLQAVRPGILLVEEAGEILESHILTALRPETRQLILIGDHKQLRPKVNNYQLTVEKGEGYDLNRSLFERLVLKGYPHTTLSAQHRMRPEIAALVKHLTYPELINAPTTLNRPSLQGVQNNVVFINHSVPEDDLADVEERRDTITKSSKLNRFEVEMVLKIVRYLGQQGYGTDKIVILTPYLGQLRELQKGLRETNDPVLNDLDSYDLVRAGLVSESSAKMTKKPIRLATIDNYQGEESDIVIISLTRSNVGHEIGFMQSQERLTVLLSRARDALIMIGNMDTFMHSRRGGEVWSKLFDLLRKSGQLYDGLPVFCERHPDRKNLLKQPSDFDKECPDGGCLEPCTTMLKCGQHQCPSKCHQLSDHSQMACEEVMTSKCLGPKAHVQQYKCHKGPPLVCTRCEREKKLAEKKQQEDFIRQEKLNEEQRLHDQRVAEIDAEITKQREQVRNVQLAEERKAALEQKLKDLELAKVQALAAISKPVQPTQPSSPPSSPSSSSSQRPHHNTQPSPAHNPSKSAISENSNTLTSSSVTKGGAKSVLTLKASEAKAEWERQKEMEGVVNDALDAIMEMTGLEKVKEQVLSIKTKVDTALRQATSLSNERFNVAMLGNPGTGKTTVARHYAQFLASVQVIPGNKFVEKTGSGLANDGVPAVKKIIEDLISNGGGVLFVDEAYQLAESQNFGGKQVLDFLLAEMENNVGKIVFIFAGYNREMEKFFEHNPGLVSRVPYQLQFTDYEDAELLHMLEALIRKQWKGRMKVDHEDGIQGLYGRIVVRRLGRGRGREGFGNARALQNVFARIRERQAIRLQQQRREGQKPDDFLLTMEDLIGPDPARVMTQSSSWKKLQGLIGLQAVKDSVANLFDMIKRNYERELLEKAPVQVALNRVFLGSPGTGKTTVAKLYGKILAELGLISNGEVITKNPADFVGGALGQSEQQTKAILANTVGKVLIIDEAYSLYGGGKGNSDPYKTAVIDTIVAEVQSTPGEDRCVLLLGYKAQIEEMFQNVNPGLARRFAIEDAFHFEDYSDAELLRALEMKLKDADLSATPEAKKVAIEILSRLRNRPNFGNIGEVENLLSRAKTRYQQRQALLPTSERRPDAPFEPRDFDENFDRHEHATANLTKLFEGTVGCDELVAKLSNYQQMTARLKKQGKDPRTLVPTNFVFKGPPGTGKTTTARKMGQVYYDMGFLSSTEVVECSASDLVGQYVGQTGPKTRQVFERALGRVLFIDEAYRLSEGHFAKEAMDELVGILTQEAFRGKLVVIIAGYDQEMNELLAVNPGLNSRFPDEVVFRNFTPDECLQILSDELQKNEINAPALSSKNTPIYAKMTSVISNLSCLSSWGNARDIITMAKKLVTVAFGKPLETATELSADEILSVMLEMLTQRRERSSNLPRSQPQMHRPPVQFDNPSPKAHRIETTSSIETKSQESELQEPTSDLVSGRDPGVPEDVWLQLQADKKALEEREKREAEEREQREQELREAVQREQELQELQKRLAEAVAKDAKERDELMRQREQARLQALAERVKRARIQAEIEARRKEEEKRRKEEARVQAKIRDMGVCPVGFRWIKQVDGYRCAGGAHFLTNGQLGIV